jgi:hypothetical protein
LARGKEDHGSEEKGKLGGGAPKQEQDLLYSAQQIWLMRLGALSRAQAGPRKPSKT